MGLTTLGLLTPLSALAGALFAGLSALFTALAAFQARNSVRAMKDQLAVMKEQLSAEQSARKSADERKVAEERLFKYYGPLYGVISDIQYKYGAHFYLGLEAPDRTSFLKAVSKDIYYGDAELINTYYEFRAALSVHFEYDPDDPENNKSAELAYVHLKKTIIATHDELREYLGLPGLGLSSVEGDRLALYDELEREIYGEDEFPMKAMRSAIRERRDIEEEDSRSAIR